MSEAVAGFPRPFRAGATDLISGNEGVVAEWLLADAFRASIAIPGVFTPPQLNRPPLVGAEG